MFLGEKMSIIEHKNSRIHSFLADILKYLMVAAFEIPELLNSLHCLGYSPNCVFFKYIQIVWRKLLIASKEFSSIPI